MSKTYATCGHEIHEGISTSILENDEVITYGTYCVDCLSNFYKNKVLLNRELMTIFSTIKKLKQENEKLKKCVEFYANRFSWNFSKHDTYENYAGEIKNDESLVEYKEKDGDIFEDYCGGKLARQTLKEIEESK